MSIKPEDIKEALRIAAHFDVQRHCGWNNGEGITGCYGAPEFRAADIPEVASLGRECSGTLLELALLHTLRPCKKCGSTVLYVSAYQVCCCTCFGDAERCENREEAIEEGLDPEGDCCCNCAENANLPDAVTRWNLWYGDDGPRGRVEVVSC